MRVIGGKFRSRRLKGPGLLRVRPTSDRLRETLFNVLGAAVEDSLFVDLYAGTGAIGIEALSRGAREVVFAEKHAATIRLLRQNLDVLGVSKGVELVAGDALAALERLAARRLVADFVFLDPPYERVDEYGRVLEFIDASHLLVPTSRVIVEHSVKVEMDERFERIERARLIEQGDAALSFYRLAAAA
ncbi:MAG TPA: 16S rRNA (guanine(966)-N(2))-methyltransferase RsmD [Candidatus Acidoferrum sp.]|jgi:16S rRNA (guanine966-N2)-methyltransferase|nr:16S rRNA (guanine(966)-N(2))-methyltransferase RsmD [Candidatus Acidoferrum sp.]